MRASTFFATLAAPSLAVRHQVALKDALPDCHKGPSDCATSRPDIVFRNSFLSGVLQAPDTRTRAVMFDVGANNGHFSDWTLKIASNSLLKHARNRIEAVMVEPNPVFNKTLSNLVAAWSGKRPRQLTYVPAAAWKNDVGTVTLTRPTSGTDLASVRSTIIEGSNDRSLAHDKVSVPTVDLARLMRERLEATPRQHKTIRGRGSARLPPPLQPLCGLKLDIEAAEFELLPHLLLSGSLCRCHYFLFEWHLNSLPPARRLAGLHLRESIDGLLTRGCSTPPRRLLHDDFPRNNLFAIVPGLAELVDLHNGTMLGLHFPPRSHAESHRLYRARKLLRP